jgi:hypothetical protein
MLKPGIFSVEFSYAGSFDKRRCRILAWDESSEEVIHLTGSWSSKFDIRLVDGTISKRYHINKFLFQ